MVLSPKQNFTKSCLFFSLVVLGILVLVGTGVFAAYSYFAGGNQNGGRATSTPTSTGIGVTTESGGELIGISDGRYAFDTIRLDRNSKIEASAKLKSGDAIDAEALWRQATAQDTNDAESLIYLEDQQVLASHARYVTFVVGTMLTGGPSNVSTGHDNLQGAYVAQKEYNDGFKLKGGVLVRLLVANAGSKSTYATIVARQIVQLTKADRTIIGVMGWPFSSYALAAVSVLSQAHIPMVSPTASTDSLTGKSSFFFRVVPSNNSQAIAGAKYAEQQLQVTRAAIFVDPNNAYSASLASDFKQQFTNDRNQIVATENYTVGQPTMLPSLLQDAMNSNPQPQLIYFAGYADDMGVLLTDLPSNVQVIGGDALYELGAYPSSARAGFERLHFTAFAYPDEWLYLNQPQPAFFANYAEDFDPQQQHIGTYGYHRPDNDVILSYDATLALLQGCNNALAGGTNTLTPDVLQQNMKKVTGSQAIQGISGQISFGTNGDPINKAIVVLYVDPNGDIHLTANNGIQGCFLLGQCTNS